MRNSIRKHLLFYFLFLIILILIGVFVSFFTSPFIRNFLGEILFLNYHQNNFAIKILNTGTSSHNSNFKTYYLLGRIYFVQGGLANSVEYFTKSINLNPEFKESYYGRGLAYGFIDGKFLQNAEKDFLEYIDIEEREFQSTGRRAYGAWAAYNDLAWIYFLMGDFVNQEKYSRLGLSITAQNAWLSNNLGVALTSQKKCKEALIYLTNAEKILETKTVAEFGQAYSGDSPNFWGKGLREMKQVIVENLKLCENKAYN